MIDVAKEEILSLAQAASELPRLRRGRKVHVATLYRYTLKGCRGVVLESIQIGATRCTSKQAIQRFCERLTEHSRGQVASSGVRTTAQRQRLSEAAARRLEELGV